MFAGIGGFDLGFTRAGFTVAWCIEWDKSAQAVLRKRFPEATIYGDIREVDPEQLEKVDVICGGFPCQDLSVAGKRKGLAGERSGLFHDAMRLVRRINPSLLVLENVPGLLSSNRGLDFATVLREVGEGWDCAEVAWRVLDSRYFGVAQRRRRVFVVASAREGCAEQVLALAEGVQWHPAPRDEAREDSADDAARSPKRGGGKWWDGGDTAASMTTRCHAQSMPDKANFAAVIDTVMIDRSAFNQGQNAKWDCPIEESKTSFGLIARGPHAVAVPINDKATRHEGKSGKGSGNGLGIGADGDPAPTLTIGDKHAVAVNISNGEPRVSDVVGTLDAARESRGSSQQRFVMQSAFRKSKRAQTVDDDETWVDDGLANTLNGFDTGDTRTTHAVAFGIDAEMNGSEEVIGCMKRGGTNTSGPKVAISFKTGNSAKARSDGMAIEQSPTLGSGAGGNTVPAVAVLGDHTHTLTHEGHDASEDGTGRGTPVVAFNWQNGGGEGGSQYACAHGFYSTDGTHGVNMEPEVSPAVKVGSGLGIPSPPAVATRMVVRRLTPVECERLQGFPDGWTQIGTADKPTADSHRYKQLGNAVTVNVAEWIARRAMKALKGEA